MIVVMGLNHTLKVLNHTLQYHSKLLELLSCTTNHLMPLTIKGNNHNLGIKEGLMTIIYCYHCYQNITIPLNFTTLIYVITATQSITIPLKLLA